MAHDWVRSPEDHQISSILDLAQSASRLTHFLQSHDRWGVAQGGGRIDGGSDPLTQGDGGTLSVGAAAGQAVNQRRGSRPEEVCRLRHSDFERDRLAFDYCDRWLPALLTKEPRFG